jgi:hypothetical protein
VKPHSGTLAVPKNIELISTNEFRDFFVIDDHVAGDAK